MQTSTAVELLYNRCRDSGHCHVLLDPQAGSSFDEPIKTLDEKLAPRVHLRDPLFANDHRQAPLLLSLPLSEVSLIDKLVTLAEQEATDPYSSTRSVCGFLQATTPVAQLASRLSSALNLKLEQRDVYFRYFDPRVFHHLPRLLSPEAFGQLFQGVANWSYFLWDGSLSVQEIPESRILGSARIRLTPAQAHAFDTIEHFNATQRLFARIGASFEPEKTGELFVQVLKARAMGMLTPDDTAYYLACSQQVSKPLSQHAAWPDVLALLKHEVPLSEALAQLCGVSLSPA